MRHNLGWKDRPKLHLVFERIGPPIWLRSARYQIGREIRFGKSRILLPHGMRFTETDTELREFSHLVIVFAHGLDRPNFVPPSGQLPQNCTDHRARRLPEDCPKNVLSCLSSVFRSRRRPQFMLITFLLFRLSMLVAPQSAPAILQFRLLLSRIRKTTVIS